MRDQGVSTEASRTEDEQGRAPGYEPPQLTPLGNLNGLLANTSGSLCDLQGASPGTGTDISFC
jgi:hypothetical protein